MVSSRKLAALCAALTVPAGFAVGTTTAAAEPCAPHYVINANGPTQQGPGAAYVNTLRDDPGTVVLDSPVLPDSFDASTNANSAWVQSQLADLDAQCPGSTKEVTGWSAGAEAAGNGVSAYAQQGGDTSDTELYMQSDPRREVQPDGSGGIDTQLPVFLPGITMDGERPGYGAAQVQSVCNEGRDIVCSFPDPTLGNVPEIVEGVIGYATGGHTGY